jgi:hypothetical protein
LRVQLPGVPVAQFTTGAPSTDAAQRVGPPQELIGHPLPERHTLLLAHRVDPAHEPREVELPFVRRHVGALHVAELALVALVDHLVALGVGQRRDVAVFGVDEVEQGRERRAQVEAEPAAVAQVEDPVELDGERAGSKYLGSVGS